MQTKFITFSGIVAFLTLVPLIYELFFSNRLLPDFDLNSLSSSEVSSLYSNFESDVAYLTFSFERSDLPSVVNVEDPTVFFSRYMINGLEVTFIIPVQELLDNPYSIIGDYRAEDYSFRFEGPVHVRAYEGEGMPYIRIERVPITDSIEEKTRCTRSTIETSGVLFVFSYLWNCIL